MLLAESPLHHALDVTLAYNPLWDVFRYAFVAFGAWVLTKTVQYFHHRRDDADTIEVLFNALFVTFAMVQELHQIGEELLVWRLPVLLVLNILLYIRIRLVIARTNP